MGLFGKLINNKEIKNASWIILGRIMQMLIAFVVSVLTARYLGPSNYGIINYASAYITFFTPICTLGTGNVVVKEFIDSPSEQGKTIGTILMMRGIASFCSCIAIGVIVLIVDYGEKEIIISTILCSLALIFQIVDTLNYWFQSRYESKTCSIASLIGYIMASIYKIILLINNKSVVCFAFASSIDYVFIALFLLYVYRKNSGPKFTFDLEKGKEILKLSYHYILPGVMVAVCGQTDKIMLKHLLSEEAVGYYSLAFSINSMWVFVLTAIIDSMYPTILYYYNQDKNLFEKKNRQLYAIIIYVSIFVAVIIFFFGRGAICLIYGEKYSDSANILKIIAWYTMFSYLGVARNAWIVCRNKQRYLKYIYIGSAFGNVLMNALLIPIFGAEGAAFASLLAQFMTSIFIPLFIKEMRPNIKLMLDAFLLREIK